MSLPKGQGHLKHLDGLRALAAIYVVLHHAKYYLPEQPEASAVPIYIKIIFALTSFGHYAVTIFIVLSGYCLMLPVIRNGGLNHGALHFFKRRAIRILPPYFIAIGMSLLLIKTVLSESASIWGLSLPVTMKDVYYHVFLIQDLFVSTASKINYILWSISVEWRIYLIFPLLIGLRKKYNLVAIVLVMLGLSYAAQASLKLTALNATATGICAHYFGLFGVGMLACEIGGATQKSGRFSGGFPWGKIAFVMFGVASLLIWRGHQAFYVTDFAVASWLFCLLIHLDQDLKGLLYFWLSSRFLSSLGLFSYSIYLSHPFALELVRKYFIAPANLGFVPAFQIMFTFGIAVVLLVGYAFHIFFEKPFLGVRK